jgi:glycosyltransferase involved in cell wall biosynthesis
MIKHVDRFIAPSHFVRERYANSHLGLTSSVLPHFLVPRLRQPAPDRRDYYLCVGRLERAKGVQTLFPHFRANARRLVVAGSGLYEAEWKNACAGNPNIEFIGRVPHNELPRWYAGARATIVPSICYETFGLTVLESLQQGTPVIASDFGALPETVRVTEGGKIYHSPEELEAILSRFDNDPSYAGHLGEHGATRLAPYSPEAHLRSYLELIEDCRAQKVEWPVETY